MSKKVLGFWNYTVILTYVGLACALAGIFLAFNENFIAAIGCLFGAGFCDAFDGAIASTKKDRTDNEKLFGMQIDSLCDLVCFGVMPAIFTYAISGKTILSAVIAIIYVLLGVVRLAYFNVLEDNRHSAGEQEEKVYYGLPITLSSLGLPLIFILYQAGLFDSTIIIDIFMALIGIAFVVPFKLKNPSLAGRAIMGLFGLFEIAGLILVTVL